MRYRGADGAEGHTGEPTAAVAADDDELGGRGKVEQVSGWTIVHYCPLNVDAWIALLVVGQAPGQHLADIGEASRIFRAEHL